MIIPADATSRLAGALRDAAGKPWAIQQDRAADVAALVADASLGRAVTTERLARAIGTGARALVETPEPKRIRSVNGRDVTAVVPIAGLLLFDLHLPPFVTSTRWIAATIRELAADKTVTRIVLAVDSPGGVITGVQEAADAIFAARQIKTIIAVVSPLAASAAYWIASQAHPVIAMPSGETGSIGVFILHTDISGALEKQGIKATFIFSGEHKTEGNALEPLSPSAREFFQSQVDLIGRQFNKVVARGRGTTEAKVLRDFGQGRTFFSAEALRVGMIDGIGTIDQVLAGGRRLLLPSRSTASTNQAAVSPAANRSGAARQIRSRPLSRSLSESEFRAGRRRLVLYKHGWHS